MLLKSTSCVKRVLLNNNLRSVVVYRSHGTTPNNEQVKGNYDIIIAGGGMVGCTLACSLGKNSVLSKLKILLLEGGQNKQFEMKTEYSNRVVALNQNTKALMNKLKIWRHVENVRLQPVRHMQVWDACSDALITFSSSEIMDDDVCYIVENDLLLDSVNKELNSSEVSNVNIVYEAKIASYDLPKSNESNAKNLVKMSNGDVYSCQLLAAKDKIRNAKLIEDHYNDGPNIDSLFEIQLLTNILQY